MTVSSKRQITLAKEELSHLEIEPRNKLVAYKIKGGLLLKPLRSPITKQTAGSLTRYVKTNKLNTPFSKILEETKKRTGQKLASK